ncbi:UNVERIFIED_CONTAM: hypothetical protein HDU68_005742 [Siphonaria sp. JEL0065]|nr:hypothetical protein HDU68_005742 [Siphonaria sp. JEL0065]
MSEREREREKEAEKHALTLKVMRLSKPSLATLPSLNRSSLIAPIDVLSNGSRGSPDGSPNGSTTATTAALALPPSFGSLFLGETFESYLCIVNESTKSVPNPSIKAELQTQTQRFTLADTTTTTNTTTQNNSNSALSANSTPIPSLSPSKSAEFLISHEIKELGPHILVCSVSYSGLDGSVKSFRKFFKFHVLNPLSVKTKVNSLADGSKVFLEAQVMNTCGVPMFLESVKFEGSMLFGVQDVGSHMFSDTPILNDKDARQYLYILTPKIPNDPLSKTTPTLGKLDIQWRTTMGQQGRLQTSQLTRKITPQLDPIRVELVRLDPPAVVAEKPFRATCRLWNLSVEDQEIDATVLFVKAKMSSVLLVGPSERKVGVVGGGGFVDFDVDFFPLLSGVQKVSGLKVLDARSNSGFEVDVLCEVVVN